MADLNPVKSDDDVAAFLQAVVDPPMGGPACDLEAGTTVFDVEDVNGWIEGQRYESRKPDGTYVQDFTVLTIDPRFDGTARISLVSPLSARHDRFDRIYISVGPVN